MASGFCNGSDCDRTCGHHFFGVPAAVYPWINRRGGKGMSDFYPLKGRFSPNESIALRIECDDPRAAAAEVRCFSLDALCHTQRVTITGERTDVMLPPMHREGIGYGVETVLMDTDGVALCLLSTAYATADRDDIVRYGFLTDFSPDDEAMDDVLWMSKCHIDHVLFYDWSYRHDTLVAPMDVYTDMMGKQNHLGVIRQKIEACHRHGMKAMAYGAVYAASEPFWRAHPSWGMFHSSGAPLRFIDVFYLMNIDSPWREHLMAQYQDAIARVGFDGIHMDAYGEPKRARAADGTMCDLEEQLPRLIEDTSLHLRNAGIQPHLIFNNVGAWPVRATEFTPQEAVYIEVWEPYVSLRDLRQLALDAWNSGKPVVLAAYMAPFRNENAVSALYAALLAAAAIAFAGATQLCLGENGAMLTQGYYADYTPLQPFAEKRIRAHQDFFVRYQNLLFDRTLRDVSMTHFGWDNVEYRCDTASSVTAEPGKLWFSFRENARRKLITVINLCGNDEANWNKGKNQPLPC
ncbi:MAG: glycoside hydrolase family 66 protein, partial [Bacillota bacterium]